MKRRFLACYRENKPFLDYENIGLKKLAIHIFSKGVSRWFWSKGMLKFFLLFLVIKNRWRKSVCWRYGVEQKLFKTIRTSVLSPRTAALPNLPLCWQFLCKSTFNFVVSFMVWYGMVWYGNFIYTRISFRHICIQV